MLDSKAVAAIRHADATHFKLYVRGDYLENLGIYCFYGYQRKFKSELEATLFYKKTYPNGILIPFDQLTEA